MSARKTHQDLNISGFSPIKSNTQSPFAAKSPVVKDYGVTEAIEAGREKLIAGYDKWMVATNNGLQYLNIIHNIKDKARRSSEPPYPAELENYNKKLEVIKLTLTDVIDTVAKFKLQIKSSINILATMKENPDLKNHLLSVSEFLNTLEGLYTENFKKKQFVIENISHTKSLEDSHSLIAAWSCDSTSNLLFKLITQLKISSNSHRWSA